MTQEIKTTNELLKSETSNKKTKSEWLKSFTETTSPSIKKNDEAQERDEHLDEFLKFKNMELKYPTEECIQQMEIVLRNWWSIQEACCIIGISYKRLKNWTNQKRRWTKYFTKKQQLNLIRRLRAAQAFCAVKNKASLMFLAKTDLRAALKVYDIVTKEQKEEEKRFVKRDTFWEDLMWWKYDFNLEEDEDDYFDN